MTFKEKIRQGVFALTSEIGPPKGIETHKLLEDAELIRGRVDAINVTDLQSSVMRLGSLAVSSLLKQKGFDPVFGARPLKRTIQRFLEDSLASEIISKKVKEGSKIKVTRHNTELNFESC